MKITFPSRIKFKNVVENRNGFSYFLLDSYNELQLDCIINTRSTRFPQLNSIFGCTVPALDPRHLPNDLQSVIFNGSSYV
ncbi:hypothetical protein T02_10357 [Trichinella nativa]|uniref:Uncharacterized protein n=1 Tax=Trichinella nativa TaxID=6335 RepID=A0A0V1LHC6_9BILA|nr:hypothetical protein T02_10357 [Trichinella nativa]